MCCASIHLLIGALLVFAVENEATTMITSTENTTAPVSVFIGNTTLKEKEAFLGNFTTPFSTVTLSNTTGVNTTSDGESESPTPPPSEHPQTSKYTTEDPLKTVSQSSTNNMIRSTTSKATSKTTTTQDSSKKSQGPIYAIILVIVVLCLSGVLVYFCCQKKSRKYSVDLHPKQEDAQIPLSAVDVEVFDTTSVKDMQTSTPVESTGTFKDPVPVKEAEKPEGEKESADVQQENQQNLSSTQATVNPKDKMDGLTVVDLTDEPTISTKTSMESLDDTLNENNSNNTRAEGNGNGHEFTEISIDALLLK